MYKVYLKFKTKSGTEVPSDTKTTTKSPDAAKMAFIDLINRTDLNDKKAAAIFSYNNEQLMYHRFDRNPGDSDYVTTADVTKFETPTLTNAQRQKRHRDKRKARAIGLTTGIVTAHPDDWPEIRDLEEKLIKLREK